MSLFLGRPQGIGPIVSLCRPWIDRNPRRLKCAFPCDISLLKKNNKSTNYQIRYDVCLSVILKTIMGTAHGPVNWNGNIQSIKDLWKGEQMQEGQYSPMAASLTLEDDEPPSSRRVAVTHPSASTAVSYPIIFKNTNLIQAAKIQISRRSPKTSSETRSFRRRFYPLDRKSVV